ncbi:MAG: leucine-rich repeat protein [Ruminococcus sp.]|nr:leucine-rich repeat protein [Ruminococcus sp.]
MLYDFVVDDSTFSSGDGVKSVVIKSRVTIIKNNAFDNCSKLTSAAIPAKRGDFCVLQRRMLDVTEKMQYT